MIFRLLQSPLQFNNGGIRIIFLHQHAAQQVVEIRPLGPHPNGFLAFSSRGIEVAGILKSTYQTNSSAFVFRVELHGGSTFRNCMNEIALFSIESCELKM